MGWMYRCIDVCVIGVVVVVVVVRRYIIYITT